MQLENHLIHHDDRGIEDLGASGDASIIVVRSHHSHMSDFLNVVKAKSLSECLVFES